MKEKVRITVKSRVNPRQKWRIDFDTIYDEGLEVIIIRKEVKP